MKVGATGLPRFQLPDGTETPMPGPPLPVSQWQWNLRDSGGSQVGEQAMQALEPVWVNMVVGSCAQREVASLAGDTPDTRAAETGNGGWCQGLDATDAGVSFG